MRNRAFQSNHRQAIGRGGCRRNADRIHCTNEGVTCPHLSARDQPVGFIKARLNLSRVKSLDGRAVMADVTEGLSLTPANVVVSLVRQNSRSLVRELAAEGLRKMLLQCARTPDETIALS